MKNNMNHIKIYGLLVGLMVIIMAVCDALTFKTIRIMGYDFAASGLIYSLSFFISSIITEVYGYKLAGRIIWVQMICNIFFILTLNFIVFLPSPPNAKTHMLYFQLYGHVSYVLVGSCISIPIAYFVNSFIISKLKIYTYGRVFIVRFFISNAIGSAILVSISYPINFYNQFKILEIATIAFDTWIYKIVIAFLLFPLCTALTKKIKKIEQLDYFDYEVNYNPITVFSNKITGKNLYGR